MNHQETGQTSLGYLCLLLLIVIIFLFMFADATLRGPQ